MVNSRRWKLVVRWACVLVAAAVGTAYSALDVYMRIEGQNQGVIEGESTRPGLENWIEVEEITHLVEVPIDEQTGLPTGARMHRPFVVGKCLGKSSPKLCQAIAANELCQVELRFFRQTLAGDEHYYTIRLEDVLLIDYHPITPVDDDVVHEKVAFTYQRIVWTYEPDGIEAQDDLGGASP